MSKQTIGLKQKPIVLGAREKKILAYLQDHWNLGERLKDIIEACEKTRLSWVSPGKRKRLEIYYLSSLKSLIEKRLIFKDKHVEETKLYIWDGGNWDPSWHHSEKRKVTLYGTVE